jgi:hypothetical protein
MFFKNLNGRSSVVVHTFLFSGDIISKRGIYLHELEEFYKMRSDRMVHGDRVHIHKADAKR